MSAEVTKNSVGRYLAWCEAHEDGWQAATKKTAQKWAERHNATEHGENK